MTVLRWLAVPFAAMALSAQTPPAPPPAPPSPPQGEVKPPHDRVAERADEMREHIVTGKQVKSHVRVAVRLKNGNKLVGVVKDGRMVERVDGLRFVDANARDRGAGIRLWYSGGTRNYVFVRFADFQGYEVLQRLSKEQLDEIEREMQMTEQRAAERAAQDARSAAARGNAPTAKGADAKEPGTAGTGSEVEGEGEGEKAGDVGGEQAGKDAKPDPVADAQAQQRAWFQLLQDYPPADGWNKARRDEIAQRFVVVGAQPSAREKAFVDRFTEWEQACAHFGIDPNKKPEDGKKKGKRGRSR